MRHGTLVNELGHNKHNNSKKKSTHCRAATSSKSSNQRSQQQHHTRTRARKREHAQEKVGIMMSMSAKVRLSRERDSRDDSNSHNRSSRNSHRLSSTCRRLQTAGSCMNARLLHLYMFFLGAAISFRVVCRTMPTSSSFATAPSTSLFPFPFTTALASIPPIPASAANPQFLWPQLQPRVALASPLPPAPFMYPASMQASPSRPQHAHTHIMQVPCERAHDEFTPEPSQQPQVPLWAFHPKHTNNFEYCMY